MKYSDGAEMQLGDEVVISGKYYGVVVANIDDPAEAKGWGEFLESGVMIDTDFGGLVHYTQETMGTEQILLKHRKIKS